MQKLMKNRKLVVIWEFILHFSNLALETKLAYAETFSLKVMRKNSITEIRCSRKTLEDQVYKRYDLKNISYFIKTVT